MFARILGGIFTLIVFVQASGDFIVLHSPDNLVFKGNKELDQSLLRDVFSAALGFTIKSDRSEWNGMFFATNQLEWPEAVVAVAIEGVDSLKTTVKDFKGKRFPLNVDESEETTWQALSGRIQERDHDNTLVRIYLGDGLDALGQSALGELKPTPIDESSLEALSSKNEVDRKFIDEIQLLQAIAKKVPSAIKTNLKPDVYWFVVSGLKPVFDTYGNDTLAAKEALTLLNKALDSVSKAFKDVYHNQVLITAFTNDVSQVRHSRSVKRETGSDEEANLGTSKPEPEEEDDKNKIEKNDKKHLENNTEDESKDKIHEKTEDFTHLKNESSTAETDHEHINDTLIKKPLEPSKINYAPEYSENYPVIFNIILWSGIIFFFSLLAICITIAEMDPGRDSIIYRMTSNRMKKDN